MTKIKVSVYRRSDIKGRAWAINYRLPGGKRIRRTVSHRRDLAQLIARDIETRLNQGEYDPERLTIKTFADSFLANIEDTRSKKHLWACRRILDAFCEDYGRLRLISVNTGHIEQFLSRFKHQAPATQARQGRELKAFFNTAIRFGYIPYNPCSGVRLPRVPRNPPTILDKAEVRKLLNAAKGTPYHGVLATALYAGLRREELVWLEWEDVDLKKRQIYVKNKDGHPLKDHEARTVPIPDELVEVLQQLPMLSNWVFTSPAGMRWDPDNLTHRLPEVFRKAKLECGLQRLRHTYASHLVMAGVDLASVQKLLGHSSITTTMIYAHVAQEHLKEQVEKLKY